MKEARFQKVREIIKEEKVALNEYENLTSNISTASAEERTLIQAQIGSLEKKISEYNERLKNALSELIFTKPLEIKKSPIKHKDTPKVPSKLKTTEESDNKLKSDGGNIYSLNEIKPIGLEGQTIRRLRKEKEKKKKEEEERHSDKSEFSKISSELFSKTSRKLLGQKTFKRMEKQLIRANLNYTPVGYISIIIMATFISAIVAGFLFLFFLFFNFEATLPIITRAAEPVNIRFLKVFWILFTVPIATFAFMYLYPAMERRSAEDAIEAELPFATIHMSAISGSMVNPIKIFEIIITTKEYPALAKEFTKMINEINLYGYDLVSALKNTAKNNPSKKLAELLNGLSTTIHSGGDLSKFFEKRAQTFLFDYKIEQQKAAKAAETFMDLYISIVIAAPMILMLLMMIMKMSGLGIPLSVGGISLLTIMGVIIVNIIFMAFLHIRKK